MQRARGRAEARRPCARGCADSGITLRGNFDAGRAPGDASLTRSCGSGARHERRPRSGSSHEGVGAVVDVEHRVAWPPSAVAISPRSSIVTAKVRHGIGSASTPRKRECRPGGMETARDHGLENGVLGGPGAASCAQQLPRGGGSECAGDPVRKPELGPMRKPLRSRLLPRARSFAWSHEALYGGMMYVKRIRSRARSSRRARGESRSDDAVTPMMG